MSSCCCANGAGVDYVVRCNDALQLVLTAVHPIWWCVVGSVGVVILIGLPRVAESNGMYLVLVTFSALQCFVFNEGDHTVRISVKLLCAM